MVKKEVLGYKVEVLKKGYKLLDKEEISDVKIRLERDLTYLREGFIETESGYKLEVNNPLNLIEELDGHLNFLDHVTNFNSSFYRSRLENIVSENGLNLALIQMREDERNLDNHFQLPDYTQIDDFSKDFSFSDRISIWAEKEAIDARMKRKVDTVHFFEKEGGLNLDYPDLFGVSNYSFYADDEFEEKYAQRKFMKYPETVSIDQLNDTIKELKTIFYQRMFH